jgi:hypothetical protein
MWHVREEDNCTQVFYYENLKENNHSQDLDVDGASLRSHLVILQHQDGTTPNATLQSNMTWWPTSTQLLSVSNHCEDFTQDFNEHTVCNHATNFLRNAKNILTQCYDAVSTAKFAYGTMDRRSV